MSSQPGEDRPPCYKEDNCNYDYCVEKRQEQCYWSSDCQYDYCIKTGYQPMTSDQTHNDINNVGEKSTYFLAIYTLLFLLNCINNQWTLWHFPF